MLGIEFPTRTLPRDGLGVARALRWMRSRGSWLELCYALVALPFVGWFGGAPRLLRLGRRARAAQLPAVGLGRRRRRRAVRLRHRLPAASAVVHVAVGAGALYAAPWLARGVAAVQVAMARLLLEPGERERLIVRVDTLEETRAGMVAAADAERRRIERDLHDGAQQRLVALAMTLGRAKATEDPVLARAAASTRRTARPRRRSSSCATSPAASTPRCSPTAAWTPPSPRSPRAARCPSRSTSTCRTAPARTAEAIAYFVVAEALTNVAKHAQRHARLADRRVPAATGSWSRCSTTAVGGADSAGHRPERPARPRARRRRRPACSSSPPGARDDPASGAAMRAVIAEDAVLLREGLARLLEEGGFEVVDAVDDGEALLRAVEQPPARRVRRRRADAADVQRRGRARPRS